MYNAMPRTWRKRYLSACVSRVTRRNGVGNTNVLTISAQHGLVNQKSFFNKIVASKNLSNYYLIERGEFAYNKSYSEGFPVGVVKTLNRYRTGVLSPLYICFKCNNSDVDQAYLQYFFDSDLFVSEVYRIAKEGARNHGLLNISIPEFFGIQTVSPPLPEQKKIAAILTSVDGVIEKTEAQIAKLKDLKTAMMQELLTNGIGHTKFKDSPVGCIPVSWEVKKLSSVCILKGLQTGPFGSQLKADEYVDNGIPVVMPRDMQGGKINVQNIARISPAKADKLEKHKLHLGDILFSRRGDIGRCAIVTEKNLGWICGTGSLRARLSGKMLPDFFIQYLTLSYPIEWLNINAVGQTMLNLNTSILGDLPVLVPPIDEQLKIARSLESLDEQRTKRAQQLNALKNLKKALMQDLLTGRVRVKT